MAQITKAQVQFVRSLQQKKYRTEHHMFVAEGEKCIGELLPHFELVLRADHTNATPLQLEQMSAMRSPQGSIAVFRQPEADTPLPPLGKGCPNGAGKGLLLALDSVQDPGNLGTIIRTADWFGVRDIYCSHGTADCFSPKVVQATMGSLGRVRVHYLDLMPWIEAQAQAGTPVYGTLLDGRNMYEEGAIASRQEGIILMGNEGNGISPELRPLISHPLYIPAYTNHETPDHVESLNVSIATAIMLSEFRR